jgi:hypothetical protein
MYPYSKLFNWLVGQFSHPGWCQCEVGVILDTPLINSHPFPALFFRSPVLWLSHSNHGDQDDTFAPSKARYSISPQKKTCARATILFLYRRSRCLTSQKNNNIENHYRNLETNTSYRCSSSPVSLATTLTIPVSISLTLAATRQTRPIPSPAFNQDYRRNDVSPLQNRQLPEMDDSYVGGQLHAYHTYLCNTGSSGLTEARFFMK